jgi:hypothetical protein
MAINEKSLKIEIEVTERRVGDLLIDALEDGSIYWMTKFTRQGTATVGTDTTYWSWPFQEDCSLLIYEETTTRSLVLDRAAIERGLKLFPTRCPEQFGRWLAEQDDGVTGDLFLQLCLFGEIVYG